MDFIITFRTDLFIKVRLQDSVCCLYGFIYSTECKSIKRMGWVLCNWRQRPAVCGRPGHFCQLRKFQAKRDILGRMKPTICCEAPAAVYSFVSHSFSISLLISQSFCQSLSLKNLHLYLLFLPLFQFEPLE